MDNLQVTGDDDWKINLREKMINSISGDTEDSAYEDIGYYYINYAPTSLYKYYSDNSAGFDSVCNDEMWYSVPSNFNDVFDSDIKIDEKKLFESALLLNPDERGMRSGSPGWINLRGEIHKLSKQFKAECNCLKETTGISCLTELDNSLLMWAHYANNHCGICVEYELMEINKQLGFTPIPVIYSSDKASFHSISLETNKEESFRLIIESFTTKSTEWSYEKEWRIIREQNACGEKWNEEKRGALLKMIRPTSITLGCASKSDFIEKVTKFCRENSINLYKMEKDPSQYQLNKTQIAEFKQ